ncbi:MAG: phosphotransferase [Alphaproteobacteria bacterium]|nr:phosphotransferase [Alphaproteobacteria bacterium]
MERTDQLSAEPHAELHLSLLRMNLVAAGEPLAADAVPGGVSCNVWLITRRNGAKLVVKQALAKLRVSADWRAPPARSAAEVAWLRLVAAIDPMLVPKILADDPHRYAFAMEYLPADFYPLWKRELAAGRAEPDFAGNVGAALARIHGATAGSEDVERRFANQAQFYALRLEPYFLFTTRRHPDCGPQLRALADGIFEARIALMQGDISPKNILHGPKGPVFLDAETACFGDPAFDLAFCLNHLLLKGVWHPQYRDAYLACYGALSAAYRAGVAWENPEALELRATALLPALMLARIDGKSPVEYITSDADKDFVRSFARQHIAAPLSSVKEFGAVWSDALTRR